jgi:hypothetical protein
MAELGPLLERLITAPAADSRARYSHALIALRARDERLRAVALEALAEQRDAARALIQPNDLRELRRPVRRHVDQWCDAFEADERTAAEIRRERAIVAHVLALLAGEYFAATRAGDSPAAQRAHALIARARRVAEGLRSAAAEHRAGWLGSKAA